MSEVRIPAEPRTEFGKGGARRTRRAGLVPAVLYGHGEAPRHISLPARELKRALKTDAGFNVLLRLELEGGAELALPKALQRDPIRGDLEHLDLLLVRQGETITTDIPIVTTGTVNADGILNVEASSVSVTAEATHIPDSIEVDLTRLRVGASVTAGQLPLPQGVVLLGDPDAVVLNILAKVDGEQLEAELVEAEADLGSGSAGGVAAAEAAAEEAGESTDADAPEDKASDSES